LNEPPVGLVNDTVDGHSAPDDQLSHGSLLFFGVLGFFGVFGRRPPRRGDESLLQIQ
jgi:hypothetical protein